MQEEDLKKKMQSQLEIKQEFTGMDRQQSYRRQRHQHEQQHQQHHQQLQQHHLHQHDPQRRIRVLQPTKYRHRDSSCRYHADLKRARELVLVPKEFSLVWGITHVTRNDDGEFKLRLLQLPNLYEQQEQQEQQQKAQVQGLAQSQGQKGPGQGQQLPFKCMEVSRESMKLLRFYKTNIRSLMLAHDKAIIFQNMDVQVYVMEEIKSEGFRVHFQDKLKTKVSLTYEQFLSFILAMRRVNFDYLKYKREEQAEG